MAAERQADLDAKAAALAAAEWAAAQRGAGGEEAETRRSLGGEFDEAAAAAQVGVG